MEIEGSRVGKSDPQENAMQRYKVSSEDAQSTLQIGSG